MSPESPADKGNIFLIGLMGVGKTTIGRLLADRLGKAFIDMDAEIEDRCGVKVAHIFDIEGEAGFRKRETKLLAELCTKSGVVVATGGGAVLAPENRKMLAAGGTVVYLCMPIPQLAHRMRSDKKRPLLQNQNIQEVLQKLHDARDPLYREIADITINSTRQPARRIANRLAANLDKRHDRPSNRSAGQLAEPTASSTDRHDHLNH